MSKRAETRQKNELVKRDYWSYLKGPGQMGEKSVRVVEQAIARYDDCMNHEDYKLFNEKKAERFKNYLATNVNIRSGKPLGLKSRYHVLRHVRKFFLWLASRPGYKSKIDANHAMYLQLEKGEATRALAPSQPKYPTIVQVKQMCSFPVKSEIDRRDRALIAFVALTGIRDQALVTLRVGCYSPVTKEVKQSPSLGVKTKFSKEIFTTLLPLDSELEQYFEEWYGYLIKVKKFGNNYPLFPSTEIDLVSPDHIAYEVKGVSKGFWADAGPVRRIFRERCKQVGLEYFYPHSLRHFVTAEAERHITTPEQMKALSQSLGHEQVGTTFRSYGALGPREINKTIRGMDFSSHEQKRSTQDQLDELKQMIAGLVEK